MTRTTEYRYNVDGLLEELVCRNGEEEQVTRWEYGVELDGDDEGVSRNDLVRAKVYPDGGGDRVDYTYNRLGEVATFTDQNGTVHKYDRDVLGRLKEDVVTLDEEGPVEVDDGVLAIGVSYTARGEVEAVTSYSDAGMVTVANEVKYEYNGFGQVTKEYQAHGSAVDPETSPKVSYDYEDGTDNSIRRTQVEYPNGRVIDLQYSGVIDERMDRVSKLVDPTPNPDEDIATYAWLGAGTVVKTGYPEPELEMTVVKASSTAPDGDAGDQYTGLDRFGRLEDARWRKTGGSMNSRVRVQYGFDRVGNRTWRRDLEPNSELFDEHYGYDGLYQVTALDRGNLNQNRTAIGGVPTWAEAWNYDEMGNWLGYTNAVDGAANLDQARLYNAGNELLAINGTNTTVAHDPAGNMTRMPAVGDWDKDTALVGQTLKWDAWNRLVEITVTDGGALVGGYQYDGLNRRITKDDGATLRHFYYSDQWQVLEERTGTSTTAERQFVWGIKGIDDLIYRETFGTGAARLYALSDGKNVVAITNTSGAVQERYVYTAFGQPTVLDSDFQPVSPTLGWETLYCGYRWDEESGLYQVRFRYYHPELGRWLNRDPIEESGGTNIFSYVSNVAIILLDVLGLRGSGHHLVPWSLFENCGKSHARKVFDAEDARICHDYYKEHNRRPYNNIPEAEYRARVTQFLRIFLQERGITSICDLTEAQAKAFLNFIESVDDKTIRDYNQGVSDECCESVETRRKQLAEEAEKVTEKVHVPPLNYRPPLPSASPSPAPSQSPLPTGSEIFERLIDRVLRRNIFMFFFMHQLDQEFGPGDYSRPMA